MVFAYHIENILMSRFLPLNRLLAHSIVWSPLCLLSFPKLKCYCWKRCVCCDVVFIIHFVFFFCSFLLFRPSNSSFQLLLYSYGIRQHVLYYNEVHTPCSHRRIDFPFNWNQHLQQTGRYIFSVSISRHTFDLKKNKIRKTKRKIHHHHSNNTEQFYQF